MEQADQPSHDAASYGGEAGGGSVREQKSSISNDQYVSASMASCSSQSCEYMTAGMSKLQISAAIETSKEQGWSELADWAQDAAAASSDLLFHNTLIWEDLMLSDRRVFQDNRSVELQLGRLIAEGGQAQIFEASSLFYKNSELVAKVFKMEGFSLADLIDQWPLAMKVPTASAYYSNWEEGHLGRVVFGEYMKYCCTINCGTFLPDGRFAFLMDRYWGDLRTVINFRLTDNSSQGPPYSHSRALQIIYEIAMGMRDLHDRGVLHRDLKAGNVLINVYRGDPRHGENYFCEVADFESSMLVQGTGFWRAPEVLLDLQKKGSDRNAEIWTDKVDVYSYAMTCYEVLTGHLPFYGYLKSDWKRVTDGERPHLPGYVDPQLQELVERCWHKEPSCRPTFKVIAAELENIQHGRKSVFHA